MNAYDNHQTDKRMARRSRKKENFEVGDRVSFEEDSTKKLGTIVSFDTERVFNVRVEDTDGMKRDIDVLKLEPIDV